MFSGIGINELLIVLVVALIVLGPKRLPSTARSLGKGMREFRESLSGPAADADGDEPVDFEAVPVRRNG